MCECTMSTARQLNHFALIHSTLYDDTIVELYSTVANSTHLYTMYVHINLCKYGCMHDMSQLISMPACKLCAFVTQFNKHLTLVSE